MSLGGGHDLRMLVWIVEGSSSFVNVVYSFLLKGYRLMVLGVWFCGKCDSSLGLLICKLLKKKNITSQTRTSISDLDAISQVKPEQAFRTCIQNHKSNQNKHFGLGCNITSQARTSISDLDAISQVNAEQLLSLLLSSSIVTIRHYRHHHHHDCNYSSLSW